MTTSETAPVAPRTFRLRTETDLLALVPYTFGFHPEDSLVLVALNAESRPFQARVDLPASPEDLPVVIEQLITPTLGNAAERVMLVAYTSDAVLAAECLSALGCVLIGEGVDVLVSLRADGRRWWPVDGAGDVGPGRPYDLRSHALTSQGVLEGQVTYPNRAGLAGSLAVADPDQADRVAAAHAALPPLPVGDHVAMVAEGRWLVELVAELVAEQPGREEVLTAPVAARVLRAVAVKDLRDLVWCAMTRADAERHLRLWRELTRRCTEELVAPAAGLLAFSAWLAGHGALARCAVERSLCADPDHTLAQLVGQALEGAMPPSTWEPVDPRSLPLHTG